MFFTNIDKWSKKKLLGYTILFNTLYLALSLLAPVIIICIKYRVFEKKSASISGMGIVVILVFAILGLRAFKKVVNKLPDNTLKQQRFKYGLLFLYGAAVPAICLVLLLCFKTDFNLAYNTFKWCLGFYFGGIVVDYFFLKFIDRERDIRHSAEFDNEKDKRRINGVI